MCGRGTSPEVRHGQEPHQVGGIFVIDESKPDRPVLELNFERVHRIPILGPDPLIEKLERLVEFPEVRVLHLPARPYSSQTTRKPLRRQ